MPVIVIANNKGGVGKTMFTTGLAAEFAMAGRKVICVDFDPQANLTRRLGYSLAQQDHLMRELQRPNISTALVERKPEVFADCLLACQWAHPWAENILLAPGAAELDERSLEAGKAGAWRRLRQLLEPVEPDVVVLIDTSPSMGHLVQMALTAATHVLAVTHAELDSVAGALYLRDFIAAYGQDLDLHCRLGGVVVNGLRKVGMHTDRLQELQDSFGDLLWEPYIPLRTKVIESQDYAIPPQVTETKMRQAFAALGQRTLEMVG